MKISLIFIALLAFVSNVNGQSKSQTIEVASGEAINSAVANDLQYAFEEFTDGTVVYKDATGSKGKLNYNYLTGEMQFLDPSTNKPLSLVNPSGVAMVTIGKRKFIKADDKAEFLELITDGNIRLAVNRKTKVTSQGTVGAYGTPTVIASATASTHLSHTIQNTEGYSQLSVKENVDIYFNNVYYLFNEQGKRILIKKIKTFTSTFPKEHTAQIEKYVADNDIKFNKEEDLIKLTNYCNQL